MSLHAQLDSTITTMRHGGLLYDECAREFQRRWLTQILEANKGNSCLAAREMGMHRNTMSRLIRTLRIDIWAIRQGRNLRRKSPGTSQLTPGAFRAAL